MTSTLRLADRDLPRIGLGTNRLSDTAEHVAFIRAAVAAGLRHIDTAHLYVGGESERVVGAALDGIDAGDVVVATKGGYRAGEGTASALSAQIEQSLRALRVDAIDLYYLHRVDPETPLEESLGVLKEHVDRGTIKDIGISDVTVEQIEQARAIVPIAAVQNHYNIAERGYDAVVDFCAAENIVFVHYYPLKGDNPAIAELATLRGVTPNAIKISWLLHRSPTILPIPGTLSLDHLRENLEAVELELSDEELATLG
jgi:pyridoxine 4-dehydrogenase